MIRTSMGAASFRIDLHVHSLLSGDNLADPEECIVRAIELGLQGLAFTEHYSYAASEPLEPLIERYRGRILVLRAVEFSAAEGHCLVFGADTDRLCLQYAPGGRAGPGGESRRRRGHPLAPVPRRQRPRGPDSRRCRGSRRSRGTTAATTARSISARSRPRSGCGSPVTGGSDAHRPEEVGSCYTVFPERVTAENLVALLRAGRYDAVDTRKISRLFTALSEK